jgi:hypothetical protein
MTLLGYYDLVTAGRPRHTLTRLRLPATSDSMHDVQRRPVDSKAVRSIGYDERTGRLELEFASGHVYRYLGVPASVVDWLERAANKGRYVAAHLSGRYDETRMGLNATPDDELVARLRASLPGERPARCDREPASD